MREAHNYARWHVRRPGRPAMSTTRLEAFSDGVFAIAATLLILEIKVPDAASGRLQHELVRQWPSFASYAVSFLVIGILWVNHHAI